jgi:cobalt/nickel transport system permease protein
VKRLGEVRRLGRRTGVWSPDLDPRVLILAVLLYVALLVSVGKHSLGQVLALLCVPLIAVPALGIPAWAVIRKIIFVSPFVLGVGLFNPLLDTRPLLPVGPWVLSAGWVSFLVIACKAWLSVAAVAVLTELLPFEAIGAGLRRLKAPEALVNQLLFLHRYLFLLVEEAQTLRKARDLKSFGRRGRDLSTTARLLGSLFLRTLERSQRIHRSMLARGFDGVFRHAPGRPLAARDWIFLAGAALVCAGLRLGVA